MGFKNTEMTNAISAQRLTDKHQAVTGKRFVSPKLK
jgi:hypothetical protein